MFRGLRNTLFWNKKSLGAEGPQYRTLFTHNLKSIYNGADKSLARPGRKWATATEDFEFHISYL